MRYQIILEGKGGELDRCEVETEQEIRLELYHALIAAVDHLEGEVRLIALAAIAKAEGREEPAARATKHGSHTARNIGHHPSRWLISPDVRTELGMRLRKGRSFMSERKKERSPTRHIGMRRDSSKPSARAATKNGAQRARAYSGPEMPVTIATTLLGYFVVVIKGPPERASLGMFSDAMPAVLAIFEQLFPESKST
jgi:hypothetical protein